MHQSLNVSLRPKSIAVFGGAQAAAVVAQSIKMGFAGEIWPVHPTKDEVAGRKAYRSVADLPGAPDAAFVGVNRHLTIEVIKALAERGAGGAVCFAAGFLETEAYDEDGERLQAELVAAAGQMPIIGPNCYGLINYADGALLWPDQHGGIRLAEGGKGVAIITQSSNIAINMTMQKRGLPIAFLMTAGNQAQTGLSEMALGLIEDERVTVARPAHRGLRFGSRLRTTGGAGARAEEADHRHEGRPLRTGAAGDRLAHRLACRLGCGLGRLPEAARHRACRFHPRLHRGAEAAARHRPAARLPAVVDELFGRRGVGHGRQRRRPLGQFP